MNSKLLRYIPAFIAYLLLQVLILNRIDFLGSINAFLYVLFIICLPVDTKKTFVLFIAAGMGLCIDMLSGSPGLHTSAAIFLAFTRHFTLRYMSPREGFEFGAVPGLNDMGFIWFVSYAAILTFVHHLFLFLLEVFRFSELGATLGRTILSVALSLALMILFQFLFYYRQSKS